LGTPICPAKLPYVFWGRDGDSLKYRCPHYATPNRLCCLKEHQAVNRCSTSPYGQVVKIKIGTDPRRHLPVPRESPRWQALYDQRTSVERVNSRLKDRCLIDALQVRGLPKVTARLTLGILVMLAAAVAMAERQRWKDIRRLAASFPALAPFASPVPGSVSALSAPLAPYADVASCTLPFAPEHHPSTALSAPNRYSTTLPLNFEKGSTS